MAHNKCLKIIFHLKNRTGYIKRYFLLLGKYSTGKANFDILVINEFGNYFDKNIAKELEIKVIVKDSKTKFTGMNSIFREIYKTKNIINQYNYVCFVEDDNFIFPKGISQSIFFLEKNKNYISCSGFNFLYEKKQKFLFISSYHTPKFFSKNLIQRAIQYKNNGGVVYYSVTKKKVFLKICKEISLIKDDNLSEVFFNYLLLISGKLKRINNMYLAREYPRPAIYNIPLLKDWLNYKYLSKDLNIIINSLIRNIDSLRVKIDKNLFLKLTIFNYIFNRINPPYKKNRGFKKNIKNLDKKKQIKKYLNILNCL